MHFPSILRKDTSPMKRLATMNNTQAESGLRLPSGTLPLDLVSLGDYLFHLMSGPRFWVKRPESVMQILKRLVKCSLRFR